ncbi:hypothetical protein D3C84_483970 [compost metagenome]
MKRKFHVAVPVLALLFSQMTQAGDTTLSMSGQILPVACTINADNAGVFDYGDIVAGTLNESAGDGWSSLTPVTANVNIQCNTPVLVGLGAIDNRTGGLAANNSPLNVQFGLGIDPDGNAIGNYQLALSNITNDGNAIGTTASADGGSVWTASSANGPILNGAPVNLIGFSAVGEVIPAPIQQLQATMSVPVFV